MKVTKISARQTPPYVGGVDARGRGEIVREALTNMVVIEPLRRVASQKPVEEA